MNTQGKQWVTNKNGAPGVHPLLARFLQSLYLRTPCHHWPKPFYCQPPFDHSCVYICVYMVEPLKEGKGAIPQGAGEPAEIP